MRGFESLPLHFLNKLLKIFKTFLNFRFSFLLSFLVRQSFNVGKFHYLWCLQLSPVLAGSRGEFSVFDYLKVSFLFRRALSFINNLSLLQSLRSLWMFPPWENVEGIDYFFLKSAFMVCYWFPGFISNSRLIQCHYQLKNFFLPSVFFSFDAENLWTNEAFILNMPVISLVTSSQSASPVGIFYPIPGNSDSFASFFAFFFTFLSSLTYNLKAKLNKVFSLITRKRKERIRKVYLPQLFLKKKKRKKRRRKLKNFLLLTTRKFFWKLFYFFKKELSPEEQKSVARHLLKSLSLSEREDFIDKYIRKNLNDEQKKKLNKSLKLARLRMLKNRPFFIRFCFYNAWFVSELNSMRKLKDQTTGEIR